MWPQCVPVAVRMRLQSEYLKRQIKYRLFLAVKEAAINHYHIVAPAHP